MSKSRSQVHQDFFHQGLQVSRRSRTSVVRAKGPKGIPCIFRQGESLHSSVQRPDFALEQPVVDSIKDQGPNPVLDHPPSEQEQHTNLLPVEIDTGVQDEKEDESPADVA